MKILITFVSILLATSSMAQELNEINWPREILKGKFTITLYQPQLEALDGNELTGRLALSIKNDKDQLTFGAMWFQVMLDTDKESRTAVLENLDIIKVKFSEIDDDTKIEKLKALIIEDLESAEIVMSLDNIISSLESVKMDNEYESLLDNTAPDIYFRSEPTVLVLIDGKPELRSVEKSDLKYVLNTPFFIVKKNESYYLKGEDHWYKNSEIISNSWAVVKSVPKDVKKLAEKSFSDEKENKEEFSKDAPKLIVVSEPSELIVTDGNMKYEPIKDTELLYVTNTESDIILEINSQTHYLLVNGRWYASTTMEDIDWGFVEPENLPEEFLKIPSEGNSISSVRTSIPGTDEAKEAMYEQYIPQTAKVDRDKATTEVKYDGKPKFEAIDGTKMHYAVNTQSTVLKIDGNYYVVDDGIWFESKNPEGPWKVSDSRPEDVDDIPPSSPVYNVKYVYIYDSTPDIVYVGYTPGYYHSYIYGGTVVYGTGYYYQPWYGAYYYPRPVTYGFGVHYNPYTGWGFSVGVSYGWLTLSFSSHSYWGPGGYAHGYRHGYYHGYHHGYHNGYAAGYARGRYDGSNVYRNRGRDNNGRLEGRDGVSTRRNNTNNRLEGRDGNLTKRDNSNINRGNIESRKNNLNASSKKNNLYSDRSGNVYQRDNTGNWSQKRNNLNTNSNNLNNKQRQDKLNRSYNTNRKDLNRQYNNRTRGNTNYNNYKSNRSRSGSFNRGSRGGVRGRRG